ncbi:MAG TPA: hypothetical protein VIT65_27315 [Microlunatus sp.]
MPECPSSPTVLRHVGRATALLLMGLSLALGFWFAPGAAAEPPSSPSPSPLSTLAPVDEDDEDAEEGPYEDLNWITGCATEGGTGAEVQVSTGLEAADGTAFEWTLRLDGTVIIRETFTYNEEDDETGPHHLAGLAPGSYRLTITPVGQTKDAVTVDFEVLRCVSAVGGCRTITFTNPAANPALRFKYQTGNDDGSDDEDVDDSGVIMVPPGESRTVASLRRVAGYGATRVFRSGQPRSFGGEDYEIDVDQHCGATMTRGAVDCAPNSKSNAKVEAWLAPPQGHPARFKLIDFHEPIDSGQVGDDDHLKLWLSPSYYNFRAYTSEAQLPYDRVDFPVLTCLQAPSTCQGLTFGNPESSWSTVDVRYRVDDGPQESISIKAGRSRQLLLPSGASVTWRATPRDLEIPAGWRIDAGSGTVVTGVCGSPEDQLAATGGPSLLLGVGAVLGAAGFGLLRRRS